MDAMPVIISGMFWTSAKLLQSAEGFPNGGSQQVMPTPSSTVGEAPDVPKWWI